MDLGRLRDDDHLDEVTVGRRVSVRRGVSLVAVVVGPRLQAVNTKATTSHYRDEKACNSVRERQINHWLTCKLQPRNHHLFAKMAPRKIIDSHIHLWPQSASNESGHSWMTPGMPLAKQHVLSDYYQAAQQDVTESSNVKVDQVSSRSHRTLQNYDYWTVERVSCHMSWRYAHITQLTGSGAPPKNISQ